MTDIIHLQHERLLEVQKLHEKMKESILNCAEENVKNISTKDAIIEDKIKTIIKKDIKIKKLKEKILELAIEFQKFV